MNIRALLLPVLLSSALLLSACGNKGPLLPPPAPEDDEWEQVDAHDIDDRDEAGDPDLLDDDANADDAEGIDPGVDGEADEPPAEASGDDGDGDA